MPTLQEFFETSAGMLLRRWEAAQTDALLADCAGETALQLGAPYGSLLRNASHQKRILGVRNCAESSQDCALVRVGFEELPFREATFDLVISVHALEWANNPALFFREAFRVLAPEGRLILLCLNPWGPWWVRKKEKLFDCPVNARFQPLSVAQAKSYCEKYGIVDRGRFGVYCPSLSDNPQKLAHWGWCEKAGDRWWPALANAYMLSVIKKEEKPGLIGKLMPEGGLLKKNWAAQTVATRNQIES